MKALCDYLINIPSKDTPRIQESHILVDTSFGGGRRIFCESRLSRFSEANIQKRSYLQTDWEQVNQSSSQPANHAPHCPGLSFNISWIIFVQRISDIFFIRSSV
jgi:hypothetical protein